MTGQPLKTDKQAKRKEKRQPFVQNTEQEKASKNLKHKLTNPPIHAYTDYINFKLDLQHYKDIVDE